MSIIEAGTNPANIQADLRDIPPPYLLRMYDTTVDDFDQIADEDLRCEYLDGVLIVHSPASIEHEERMVFLAVLLGNYVSARRLGRVFGSNAVMQLGERRCCADLAFLQTANARRIHGGKVIGPMDLIIEIMSKSTRNYDLGEKRSAYRDGGVQEIWLLDVERQQAYADFLQGDTYHSETLNTGRIASRVVPGFSIDVTWLWSDPLPNPLECEVTSQ